MNEKVKQNLMAVGMGICIICFFISLPFLILDNPIHSIAYANNDRIERLYAIQIDNHVEVQVIHDRESGMEIICTILNSGQFTGSVQPIAISCVSTGRSWKNK